MLFYLFSADELAQLFAWLASPRRRSRSPDRDRHGVTRSAIAVTFDLDHFSPTS
jgi:hypothetical protein